MRTLSVIAVLLIGFDSSWADANMEISKFVSACLEKSDEGQFVARRKNQQATDYVGVEGGKIIIKAGLQLRYQHYFFNEELVEAMQLIEQVRPHIEAIFLQHGLELQLTFYHAPYDLTSMNPHPTPPDNAYVVYIRRDNGDHIHSLFWGVNFTWKSRMRGLIYTHEFSHKLGLKDEYDTALADRIGEEDNIMRNWDAEGAKFYPHQIKRILSPLCPS